MILYMLYPAPTVSDTEQYAQIVAHALERQPRRNRKLPALDAAPTRHGELSGSHGSSADPDADRHL